ncbi:hypothetical protein ScPMuIL_012039 [Solemya velum]
MAAGIFHVEFGINETQLTQTLEKGRFNVAEKLIRENTVPSYLDEGCYQRTSLYICLCGLDEDEEHVRSRNLYLAKLLIDSGANVNYRVPSMYHGSEFLGPGKTALELLIDFFNDLTKYGVYNNEMCSAYHSRWDPRVETVIGLNKQPLSNLEDVIEHVEDLIFIILSNGGNPSVMDECKMTPLHKTAIFSHDVRLFKLLCENGANINSKDVQGNSPLLALCDIGASEMYEYYEDLSPSSDDTLEDTSANVCVKHDFLNYLLSQKDLQINEPNNKNQTALFHCVIRGDILAATKLLQQGADPSIRGTVWETRKRKRRLSPLFASFLSIPIQRSLNWQNMYHKLITAPQQYSHLVDAGYFTRKEIVEELQEYLEFDFPEFSHLQHYASQLISSMFGQTSATLRQLSARKLFQHCFINHTECLSKLLPIDTLIKKFTNEDLKFSDTYDEYINLILNRTVLRTLVSNLSLPHDSLLNFEVELLLYQMASLFSSFKFTRPENVFIGNTDTESSDSDDSPSVGEGDSDLEYW